MQSETQSNFPWNISMLNSVFYAPHTHTFTDYTNKSTYATHYQVVQLSMYLLRHRNENIQGTVEIIRQGFVAVDAFWYRFPLLFVVFRFHFLLLCLATERKPHRYVVVVSSARTSTRTIMVLVWRVNICVHIDTHPNKRY